jgi:hypothetical protein
MQIAFNNRNKISGLECGKGVCFISFKLTKKDILQDLNFSATTPIALRSFIEEYFKISNINWNSILNKAKRNSKTYLLPVSYWFGSCPTSSDTLFIVNGEIYKATKIPSLSDTSNSYPDFFNDLLNIPNSEKGEHRNTRGQPIQYTILETVVLRKRIL